MIKSDLVSVELDLDILSLDYVAICVESEIMCSEAGIDDSFFPMTYDDVRRVNIVLREWLEKLC